MLRNQITKSQRLVITRSFHQSFKNLNSPPKSPLQIFTETFRQEWKKSKELQDGIKALQDETGKIGESDAYKKAREAYKKAQTQTTVIGKTVKKTGEVVEKVVITAWDSEAGKYTRKTVERTVDAVDSVIEPVRQTKVYKDVKEVLDDGSASRYGGFESKEQRRLRREKEIASGKRPKAVRSNEEAGNALVATDLKPEGEGLGKKIEDFQTKTTVGRQISDFKVKYWDESENPLISTIRSITEKIGGLFAETESAQVIRLFKQIDPAFNTEDFTKNLREYIIPEVLDAYVKGEEEVLKTWFSEAPYNVYNAQQKIFREQGLFADGKILDIRGVEIVSAKLLPSNIPVLVVGCRAQEIHLYRKAKTGEIAAGTESNIVMSSYAMVLTRIAEDVDDKETEGWKIMEFVRGGSRPFH
ncbi:Mitochondrial import inner membrane translocase subunit TIM44 [Wickerhamomyces ciferrii]|uniref:Mitochondrial import inner membrane translocase subunit TIM44 n=1 Tax=Wickerhamomyces ciferrii (strain ATCC 14091 / BCRC 22168 / CBS 111 / JCM 3599 / NBRC 0793 / NRRL Y-1031 F-60-10) TaxID=1206466 RepID=K0KJA5_WICCF|nr:Mitochondrial import inner membrane translocase subunit TIM44 [Wickerhamomyces ciferrii]CCH42212.1 Mitochondrial import inner membrane translocase subunit TIM44 [Wickerhamomyces ciferrii]